MIIKIKMEAFYATLFVGKNKIIKIFKMKKIKFSLPLLFFVSGIYAQNIGIGTTTPTFGKLEVVGTFGLGKTVAAFGSDGAGISLQRNSPAIGFNQYRDAAGSKFMSNGYASTITLDEATGIMAWDMYNSGFKSNPTIGSNRAITILNNGNIGIRSLGAANIGLVVAKQPENIIGTAVFDGYDHSSFFANSVSENTYIRCATNSNGAAVIINEVASGDTLMPNNTRIGLGGTISPVMAVDLYGSLGITKRKVFDICGNAMATPGNCSFMLIETCGYTPAILTLGNGTVQGQILLIYASLGDGQSFTINETANIDLASSCLMDYRGQTLLLMWRLVGTSGRWTEITRRVL